MACIPPNPRRVGYIVPIHGSLDGPLYMGSIYSNSMIHEEVDYSDFVSFQSIIWFLSFHFCRKDIISSLFSSLLLFLYM